MRRLLPLLAFAVSTALLASAAWADPLPTPTPRAADQTLTLPTASAATVAGANATLVNPAGLSGAAGLELDYLHQRSVGNDRVADGAYLAAGMPGLSLGVSMEWVRFGTGPGFRRTSYALALGTPELSIGAAYHVFGGSDSRFFDHLDSWDVGVSAKLLRFLSFGFAILDVDGPGWRGVHLPRRYDVGLGVRPLCSDRLTLSADLLVDDQAGFDQAALAYAARWRVIDGLSLYAGLTHYFNQGTLAGTVGIALSAPHLGVGYAIGADSGLNQFDHTIGLRISSEREPGFHLVAQVAVLDLDALLSKGQPSLLDMAFGRHPADPYLSLLQLLRRARADNAVQGVVLKFGGLDGGVGLAHVQELRGAIEALKAAGKPVVALLRNATDADLFLATAATKVYAVPEATLLVNGLSWDTIYLGEALGKIGVKVEVARVGAYKNAPDQLTRADMSPEQREAQETFLRAVSAAYRQAVMTDRKLTAPQLDAALGKGILGAQQAKAMGLIDDVIYPDQLGALDDALLGRKSIEIDHYEKWDRAPVEWGHLPKVALVRVQGDITAGESRSGLLGASSGAETLVKGIDAARDNPMVHAIVVRIDSPGGSGNASSLIERAIEQARAKKPVVVSMGNTAASGGYYLAVGGDAIWAEPTTLTGSIGVFVVKPDLSGLLSKLSLHDVTLKQGDRADLFSFTKPWSAGEKAAVQGYVDGFYDRFITLVAQRRKLSKDAVDKLARGRIWSGSDAKRLGLVDQLGSLDDAIRDAKKRAGLDPDERVELASYGALSSLLPRGLLEAHTQSDLHTLLDTLGLGNAAGAVFSSLQLAQQPGPVAALPFSYAVR